MIIVRSPLRITLGGGGSDIPSYYRKHGGFCVSAAIDKYVYVTITRPFFRNIFLKYSAIERVDSVETIKHSRIREVLRQYCNEPQIEITSLADIPAGTGLGSSSSFTTALLKAVCSYYHKDIGARALAEEACDIEINKLHEPIGKQDQYISAYGGILAMEFQPDGTVAVEPLRFGMRRMYDLEDNLLLFFTGIQRNTEDVLCLSEIPANASAMGRASLQILMLGSATDIGDLLNEQWRVKQRVQHIPSNIEEWRELGLKNGALGGKLVGAGGGGFLLFYAEHPRELRRAMSKTGLQEVRFRFEFEGTKVLVS